MKRFWKEVSAAPVDGGWQVMLDGRPLKTQGKRQQIIPGEALARALAQEWTDQGGEIDPAGFVLRDMADYAIDVIAGDRSDTVRALLAYGETDTLCYRAAPGEVLARRQDAAWEPLLGSAEEAWNLQFARVSGIMHQPQPPETLAKLRALLESKDNLTLAALRSLSGISASLVIALLAAHGQHDAQVLWQASELEELFQEEMWGRDAEAEARQAKRLRDFEAAIRFAGLVTT
ncbi:ATP12 family protein [Novosphingobium sp.]|uniref:ATP12 family chaperone protein n=1 Tax=Novosphingobium sp. TaxID=1874826 RepID=UPI00286E9608|nr:ATP12 family protein [Novosphingobium sp.]